MGGNDLDKLGHQFMVNALGIKPGHNVWVEYAGPAAWPLAESCAEQARLAGGSVYLLDSGSDQINTIFKGMPVPDLKQEGTRRKSIMRGMNRYIRVCDDFDLADIDLSDAQYKRYRKHVASPATAIRLKNTDWLVVSAPTDEFARQCGMKPGVFRRFYKDVCLLDYGKMARAASPLKDLLERGKTVHIKGFETDLRFSIENIPAKACTGRRNIPDGECFTAPVRESVNGTIRFGQSVYEGQRFEFIRLRFENGRIVEAEAENAERTKALNQILDTDEGARYVGEFAIAFNPIIREPMGDILFDEKIDGSLHMAMGRCYDEVPNGNRSDIHWDMVHIQRPGHGGGEIWIDDELIRKDGQFVRPDLKGLNPDNLLKASGFNQRPVYT